MSARKSLDGIWTIDSTRGDSMVGFLTVMNCSAMAIEAMLKAEIEMPTVHRYEVGRGFWTHTKKSRLNNFTECFPVGKRSVTKININKDEEKEKSTVVQSCTSKAVHIISKLSTSNGVAEVNDKKQLSEDGSHILQELSIRNLRTNEANTTLRYWIPHNHIDVDEFQPAEQVYQYDEAMQPNDGF